MCAHPCTGDNCRGCPAMCLRPSSWRSTGTTRATTATTPAEPADFFQKVDFYEDAIRGSLDTGGAEARGPIPSSVSFAVNPHGGVFAQQVSPEFCIELPRCRKGERLDRHYPDELFLSCRHRRSYWFPPFSLDVWLSRGGRLPGRAHMSSVNLSSVGCFAQLARRLGRL